MAPIDIVLSQLSKVRRRGGNEWQAGCPAHEDAKASLSISLGGDGRVLLNCHAGCSTDAVVTALGLTLRDLFPQPMEQPGGKPRIAATYDYRDEEDKLLYQVVRYDPKQFRQRRPDGHGGWLYKLGTVRRVPFRLPQVRCAIAAGRRIYWPEGEKDVLNLVRLGAEATTTAQGAAGYKAEFRYAEHFTGAHIVLLPDHDPANPQGKRPGQEYARAVAHSLFGKAASVKVLNLPVREGQDVSDWIAAGGTLDELDNLANQYPAFEKSEYWKPETYGTYETGSVGFVGPIFDTNPASLAIDLLPVPSLDSSLLPEALRGWIVDIAERGCFPIEYVVAPVIVGLSSIVGRKIGIRPKRFDSWTVVPNLWGAVIGPPGVQKTPAVSEALRPLHRLEALAKEGFDHDMEQWQTLQQVRQAMEDARKSNLRAKARKGADRQELITIAADFEEDEKPVRERYIVNDSTLEMLGELLKQNPNGLMVFRDELTGFLRQMDKQGHENERAFYLEAWNGTGHFTYDRIGRGTVDIEAACLSLFGTIQPGPLARYLRGAASGDEADGFAPRLQIMVYPDPPPVFRNVDRWPDSEAKARAFAVFECLAKLMPLKIGATQDEDDIPFLHFDPQGQEAFDAWRVALENRLRNGRETPLMQIHLAKYRSLLPSLALLFHLAEGSEGPVARDAFERAAAWCVFLEAHARRIYQAVTDGDNEGAARLAERIKQSLPNPFQVRQVVQKGWTGLSSTEEVERAVAYLEGRGWVKTVETPPGERGGRPSSRVYIHPALLPIEAKSETWLEAAASAARCGIMPDSGVDVRLPDGHIIDTPATFLNIVLNCVNRLKQQYGDGWKSKADGPMRLEEWRCIALWWQNYNKRN